MASTALYDFEGLAPGQYTVVEEVMPGWQPTTPTSVAVDTTGGDVSGIDFGDFQYVNISGTLFNDLLGDGNFDPGDPGLAGWTVDLVDYFDPSIIYQQATTDANGNYAFSNVGPGTYAVLQEIPSGWIQTFPPDDGFYGGFVVSGGNYTGLDYGDFQLVTYAGTVYNDVLGNGTFDGSDTGLSGWTVNLSDSSGTVIATAISAGDGTYSFSGIGPGSYTISEVAPSGWIITQPAPPSYSYSETAISGDSPSDLDFGNFKLATFSGNVFNDLNGNGHQDKGDPGLGTWVVDLLDASGNVVAATITNKLGNYSFTGIYPGNFTVAEVVKSGWYQTTTPQVYSLTSTSGATVTGLTFGDKLGAAPGVHLGGSVSGVSIVPATSTDLSVPSSYTRTGSSTVVVPGVSQPGSVQVVYNGTVSTKDQVSAAIKGLFDAKKKVSEDDIIGLLAKSILGA